jgi:hypothetical protein
MGEREAFEFGGDGARSIDAKACHSKWEERQARKTNLLPQVLLICPVRTICMPTPGWRARYQAKARSQQRRQFALLLRATRHEPLQLPGRGASSSGFEK